MWAEQEWWWCLSEGIGGDDSGSTVMQSPPRYRSGQDLLATTSGLSLSRACACGSPCRRRRPIRINAPFGDGAGHGIGDGRISWV